MTTGLTRKKSRAQAWFVFSFLAPPLALYALFVLLPTFNAFRYSLTRWDGLSDPVYVGLRNFKSFLAPGSDFVPAIQHNLFLMLVPGIFILSLALMFANMIHQRIKGARLFRIAFFFPNIISSVAVALLWMLIYSPTKVGLINHFAAIWFHRSQPVPYTESSRLLWSLVPMIVWSATGFYMVLFLAAMENIPETYYEAARLDGATPAVLFFRITLPMMWEVFTTGVIFLVIGGLKYFDAIWVLENGRPKTVSHTMSTLMYSRVFEQYNIGYGTAIAVLLFLLVLIATLISRRLLQREALEY
jgi:ABC-type sugar transport system permease subunit